MKKILLNGKAIDLSENDLSMIIHGKEGSGASFFAIDAVANLFLNGSKVLFFTAFPAAKEEIENQLDDTDQENNLFYLEDITEINAAKSANLIIIKSGDTSFFHTVLKKLPDIQERVIFIKNIETLLNLNLLNTIPKNKLLLSGDLGKSQIKEDIAKLSFKSKILFSSCQLLVDNMPILDKYESYAWGTVRGKLTLQ